MPNHKRAVQDKSSENPEEDPAVWVPPISNCYEIQRGNPGERSSNPEVGHQTWILPQVTPFGLSKQERCVDAGGNGEKNAYKTYYGEQYQAGIRD